MARLWMMFDAFGDIDPDSWEPELLKSWATETNSPVADMLIDGMLKHNDPSIAMMGIATAQYAAALAFQNETLAMLGKDKVSEHEELKEAIDTMLRVADIAVGASVAVFQQMNWITTDCKCRGCQMRRQREKANES